MGLSNSTASSEINLQRESRGVISIHKHITEMKDISPVRRRGSYMMSQDRAEPFYEFERHNGKINTYEIMFRVSSNSFRTVSKVMNLKTKEEFALKALSKVQLMAKGAKAVEQANSEVRILKSLKNPSIITFHDCWQGTHNLYIVTEYVSGGELFSLWTILGNFSESLVRFFIAQLIIILDFLNSHNVIYRDLKVCSQLCNFCPKMENVLLDNRGYLKLVDFGSSKLLDYNSGYRTRTICGTLSYCAPELLNGMEYSFSVDWWALGILCFVMAAGYFPVKPGKNFTDMSRRVDTHTYFCPASFSSDLTHLVTQLLQKDPKHRATKRHVLEDFDFFKSIDFKTLECRQYDPRQFFTHQDIARIPDSSLKQWILEDRDDPFAPGLVQTIGNFSWTAPSESQDHITPTMTHQNKRNRVQSWLSDMKPRRLTTKTNQSSVPFEENKTHSSNVVIIKENDSVNYVLSDANHYQPTRPRHYLPSFDTFTSDFGENYDTYSRTISEDDGSTIIEDRPQLHARDESNGKHSRKSFFAHEHETRTELLNHKVPTSSLNSSNVPLETLISTMRFVPLKKSNHNWEEVNSYYRL